MFTGIVDHCGEIVACKKIPEGLALRIKSEFNDIELGESIAVDGICLTVTESDFPYFCCELSPETCRLTTAKNFKENIKINLERALRSTDRLGGHIVMGHIDTVGMIKSIETQGDFLKVQFELGAQNKNYFVKKGSVAMNGVSLTVNHIFHHSDNSQNNHTDADMITVEVMLIPHTVSRTNLGYLNINDKINIEYDYFARYMINYLEQIELKT